jgi:hypothetical protein
MHRKPSYDLVDPLPRFREVLCNGESLPSQDSARELHNNSRSQTPQKTLSTGSSTPAKPKSWFQTATDLKARRLIRLTLILLTAVAASIARAQEPTQPSDNEQRIVGIDGSCEIMVPRTWKALPDPTGRAAITMGRHSKGSVPQRHDGK